MVHAMGGDGSPVEAVDFNILGPLSVRRNGSEVAIGSTRQRALLVALLLQRNSVVPRERLISLLWDQTPPETARHGIEVYVSGLRRALEQRVGASEYRRLASSRDGYALLVADGELDALRFTALVREGTLAADRDDLERAEEALVRALAIWRGPALAGLGAFPFVDTEATRLERERRDARGRLLGVQARMGKLQEALAGLTEMVAQHPLSEWLAAELMLTSYRAGDIEGAITAFYRLRRDLLEQLGAEPSEPTQRLLRNLLNGDVPAIRTGPVPAGGPVRLPRYSTLFVGRRREVTAVRALAAACRLVTLTGLPGIGKTRLAVEAATGLKDDFPDGIWFVELLDLRSIDRFYPAIASAIGIHDHSSRGPDEIVKRFLASRRSLLVLDNCEYLQPRLSRTITGLLNQCPNVNVLATTLQPLGIAEEYEWKVRPLALPTDSDPLGAESVLMFRDLAAAADPGFELRPVDSAAIARLMRHLDGIPLAIELTAPRVADIPLHRLAAGLGHETDTAAPGAALRPERHQTLDRAIASSWSRLSSVQRDFLCAAALFAGSIDPERVHTVSGSRRRSQRARLEVVASLEQGALVRVDSGNGGRLTMLDSVSRFALRRLEDSGRTAEFSDRYVDHFAALAITAGAELEGARQLEGLELLRLEYPNVRSCLEHLTSRGDARRALHVVGLLNRFWWCEGLISESKEWLERALALPGGVREHRAEALRVLGRMEWQSGRLKVSQKRCREALAISRALKDRASIARSLYHLGVAQLEAADYARAVETLQAAAGAVDGTGDHRLEGLVLDMLGRVSWYLRGGTVAARPFHERALELLVETGDLFATAVCLVNNAELNAREDNWAAAWRYYGRAFDHWHTLRAAGGMGFTLFGLAVMASNQRRHELAPKLLGAAEFLWETAGVEPAYGNQAAAQTIMDLTAEHVGEEVGEPLLAEGRRAAQEPTFDSWVRQLGDQALDIAG
jgi:predicted ATPase/DNA-binding SARP family transcriptional activator